MPELPTEVDPKGIKYTYYDGKGNELNADGTKKTSGDSSKGGGGGTGLLSGILGAIPGILSSLFPSGIGGGGNNTPVVTQLPNGNTNVQMQGNSNLLMYALLLMVGFLVFTGTKPMQKPTKR